MKIPFESAEKIEARATANAIFGLGIYLGGAMASLGAFIDEQDDPSAPVLMRYPTEKMELGIWENHAKMDGKMRNIDFFRTEVLNGFNRNIFELGIFQPCLRTPEGILYILRSVIHAILPWYLEIGCLMCFKHCIKNVKQ